MKYHRIGEGRYFMRMDPGEEAIGCLRQFVSEEKVTAGFITGLGSVSTAVLSFLDPETNEYVKRKFDEPMEVGNLTGTISVAREDGRPFIHLHAVLAPRELIAYSGHVHELRVGAVMEVILHTYDVKLERVSIPDKAFPWLLLPGEEEPAPGEPAS